MAQEYFPFDSGAGAAITETQWRRMARLFAPSGVETGLTVTAGSGATVNLAAGSAWVDGHYYRTDATVAVAFTTNGLAVPSTRYVVLELDPTANTITPKCVNTAPTQSPTGIYQLLLYTFTLPASGTAQTPTEITDQRTYVAPPPDTNAGLVFKFAVTSVTTNASGDYTLTFPEAFPVACDRVFIFDGMAQTAAGFGTMIHRIGTRSPGQVTARALNSKDGTAVAGIAINVLWLAIGH